MSLNFDSLKSENGLKQLNAYLASRVYVFGLEPTTQDSTLFGLIGEAPKGDGFPNVTRYYNHIQSFNADAQAKFITIEGLSVNDQPVAAAKAEAKDDDDSDSDDAAAIEAIKKAAADKKAAAKKGKKRRPPERSEIILDVKPFDDQTDLDALATKIKGTKLEDLRNKEYPGPNEDGDTWDFLEKEAQKIDERITLDSGHRWGQNHHLEEMAYGIKKLRLQCVVQNELIGSDLLISLIEETWPEEVQSVDVASFQNHHLEEM